MEAEGSDTSPGGSADVDVCTMAAKQVMYLCFCRQLLPKLPGWKKRMGPSWPSQAHHRPSLDGADDIDDVCDGDGGEDDDDVKDGGLATG